MIDCIYGEYYVCCDGCGRELEGVSADFEEALARMKDMGWRSRKTGEWENFCPICARKYLRPGASEFAGLK